MSRGWGDIGDGAALLEAMHRIDLPDEAWLDGMWGAMTGLTPDAATAMAVIMRWTPGQPGLTIETGRGASLPFAERARATSHLAREAFIESMLSSGRRVVTLGAHYPDWQDAPGLGEIMRAFRVTDFLTLTSRIPRSSSEHVCVALTAMSPRRVALSRGGRTAWERFATHLGAACRLRAAGALAGFEGVLSPSGRVLHAEGRALGRDAREALQRAVVAIYRARRADRRRDTAAVLDAWRAVYEGRWTLIESVERDGRRLMLARVNAPAQLVGPTLTLRERQVAALLAEGVAQVAISYELEISPSSVAGHVRSIARKVGASSSPDLVRRLARKQQPS